MARFATLSQSISLVFLLITAQVQAKTTDADIITYASGSLEECAGKTNLTLEYATNYSMEDAENDPRLQCFITCRLVYSDNLEDCDFLLLSDESKEELAEIVDVCREAREAITHCDCGFKWAKCAIAVFDHDD